MSEDSVYRTDEKMRSHDKNERSERVGGGGGESVSAGCGSEDIFLFSLETLGSDECSLFVAVTIWMFVTCVLKTAQ